MKLTTATGELVAALFFFFPVVGQADGTALNAPNLSQQGNGQAGVGDHRGVEVSKESSLADFSRVLRRWGADHGLTGGRADAVVQTPDGHLWVGTEDGLFRFNGRKFTRLDTGAAPELGHPWVTRLCVDRDGDIWVFTSNGRLARFDGKAFHATGTPLSGPGSVRLCAHPDGGVFAAIQSGGGQRFVHLHDASATVLAAGIKGEVLAVLATRDGKIWVGRRGFPISELKAGELVPAPNGAAVDAGALLERRDGTPVAVGRAGIFEWGDGEWREQVRFHKEWSGAPNYAVEDLDGRIWAGSQDVERIVWQRGAGITQLQRGRNSLPAVVQSAVVDADGDLWFGSFSGLFQARYSPFITFVPPIELPTERVVGVRTRPDGTIWFHGFGGIARLSPGAPQPVFIAPRPTAELTVCDAGEDGTLWIGNRYGQFFRRAGNADSRLSVEGATGAVLPLTIAVDDEGIVWTTTFSGAFRCDPKVLPLAFIAVPEDAGFPARQCHLIRVQANGDLLAASRGHGVFRRPAGMSQWVAATPPGDANAGEIGRFDQDPQGRVWGHAKIPGVIGCWTANESRTVRLTDIGLGDVHLSGMTVDREGGLWIATRSHGVAEISCDEMLAAMADPSRKPVIHWFDKVSGLGSSGGSFTGDCIGLARDGRVWVATDGGLSVIDPRQWRIESGRARAPETFIGECVADGNPVDQSGLLRLQAGTSRVDVRYAGRSFATPGEVTYRYRMRGLDDAWRDAGAVEEASFQQLNPGDYVFEVLAANRYGRRFAKPATLSLTVLPYWWQRTEAKVLLGLILAGAVGLFVKLRLNALRARSAIQAEFSRQLIVSQEEERRRIAGEIHDSLGQNLLIAKNQLYLARQMDCPGAVQEKLVQVGGSVDDALNEARAISHRLRPFQLERLGLAKAMRAVVRETSESTRIPIEVNIESVDGLLPGEAESMLFRMLQEALSNVIKHADASKVTVNVARSGARIRMRIEDDGRGFDVKSVSESRRGGHGLGLAGFKERALLLRGTFHCQSAPGEGTVLTFEIPIPDTPKHEAES